MWQRLASWVLLSEPFLLLHLLLPLQSCCSSSFSKWKLITVKSCAIFFTTLLLLRNIRLDAFATTFTVLTTNQHKQNPLTTAFPAWSLSALFQSHPSDPNSTPLRCCFLRLIVCLGHSHITVVFPKSKQKTTVFRCTLALIWERSSFTFWETFFHARSAFLQVKITPGTFFNSSSTFWQKSQPKSRAG